MREKELIQQSKMEMATALQLIEVAKMNLQYDFYYQKEDVEPLLPECIAFVEELKSKMNS